MNAALASSCSRCFRAMTSLVAAVLAERCESARLVSVAVSETEPGDTAVAVMTRWTAPRSLSSSSAKSSKSMSSSSCSPSPTPPPPSPSRPSSRSPAPMTSSAMMHPGLTAAPAMPRYGASLVRSTRGMGSASLSPESSLSLPLPPPSTLACLTATRPAAIDSSSSCNVACMNGNLSDGAGSTGTLVFAFVIPPSAGS